MVTAYWAPNQAAIAQVETYTFSAPVGVGNTYIATINGKSVTYSSISGDTATTAATALFNLLNASTGIAAEFTEITWANPSNGVLTATASVPGTPFANITGGNSSGLVMSTGNGLANGIATAHTTANASPSDVNDPQNWLRVTPPAPGVRQIPQSTDDVVIANTSVPLLWNLDRLSAVQFNTYTRWQTFTGTIGLPENNSNGYTEWRATYFKFNGPPGSVPVGGLKMILGQGTSGSGPTRERYDVQSSPATLIVLAAGQAADEYGVRFLGVHTNNVIGVFGGVSVGIAMLTGEISGVVQITVGNGGTLGIGAGVTFTTGSFIKMLGGSALLSAAPDTLTIYNGSRVTIIKDSLTWPSIDIQGGSNLTSVAGGIITALTLSTGSSLDASPTSRGLTITTSTIDGDTCFINDPMNAITFTNATSVKQSVSGGPFRFTGTRTVKVT